jgi:hypothetical protein
MGASVVGCEREEPALTPIVSPTRAVLPWVGFDAARSWPAAAGAFHSRGHGAGRYDATVRVRPATLEAYRSAVSGAVFADGSAIAMFHRTTDGGDGSVFSMAKADGAWTFVAAHGDGTLIDGDTASCARCHDEAPADHVFGPPKPTAR